MAKQAFSSFFFSIAKEQCKINIKNLFNVTGARAIIILRFIIKSL